MEGKREKNYVSRIGKEKRKEQDAERKTEAEKQKEAE